MTFQAHLNSVRFKWRTTLLSAILLFWLASVAASDTDAKNKIYQAWPKTPASQAFFEARHDVLLDLTTDYIGDFKYQSPHHFALVYRKPITGQLERDGETVRFSFPDRKGSIPLSQVPEIAAFLTPIQALLSGDPKALETQYHVRYQAMPDDGWQLNYQPKVSGFSVQQVQVEGRWQGQKVQLETIELNFANGDWRRYRFEP